MKRSFTEYRHFDQMLPRNWEANIRDVSLEPCDVADDPSGYRAVFHLRQEAARAEARKSFVVGASFLKDRVDQIAKAGFRAPMTNKALGMIEDKLSRPKTKYIHETA